MIKRIITLIISVPLFFLSMVWVAYAQDIPEYIKIGLRNGSSAVSTTEISSQEGLVFGYRVADKDFVDLYDFKNTKKLIIRKDSYYVHLNNYFFEYNFNSQKDEDKTDIIGPIHIQIGDDFSSKTEAIEFADMVSSLGFEPYLALEGNWKVWVGTFTTYNNAEKYFNELKSILTNTNLTVISKNSSRVQVTDDKGEILLIYNPTYGDYYFEPVSNDLIALESKLFRGSIMFKNATNGNLTVINRLKMDEYLYGVVPKEMNYTWPMEALKAQAIAARNYAVYNINKHKSEGFNLCSTSNCQAYGGYSAEKANSNQAVDETSDLVLTHNGNPIVTYYHSNSGGHTEDSEHVWSNEVIAYLRGVEDDYSGNYNWQAELTKEEISKALRSAGYSIGNIKNVYVSDYSRYGSALKLVVEGNEGAAIIEKDNIRKILGYNIIKSLKFYIGNNHLLKVVSKNNNTKSQLTELFAINGNNRIYELGDAQNYLFNGYVLTEKKPNTNLSDTFVFSGSGYGHSLGMSQQGAKAMAEAGYTYEEILLHYFTGVELTPIH